MLLFVCLFVCLIVHLFFAQEIKFPLALITNVFPTCTPLQPCFPLRGVAQPPALLEVKPTRQGGKGSPCSRDQLRAVWSCLAQRPTLVMNHVESTSPPRNRCFHGQRFFCAHRRCPKRYGNCQEKEPLFLWFNVNTYLVVWCISQQFNPFGHSLVRNLSQV